VHPIPEKHRGHGGGSLRTPFGQSGGLCGLKLVPSKWRGLVPPQAGTYRVLTRTAPNAVRCK